MSKVMDHRGPDDSGSWTDSAAGIGLCHRRLSIIDTSTRGHQPMWDSSRRVAIAFNGEIYDYQRLRKELQSSGFAFSSGTDTEVVLNLWIKHGRAALEMLNGMFALAIWDTRDATLTLARDLSGIKPLYLSETSEGVLFASETKALLQSAAVTREIDPVALLHTVTYLWSPGPRTILSGVKKVAAGGWVEIQGGRIKSSGVNRFALTNRTGLSDAPHKIRNELRRAVHEQLVADVPTGAFLSGGVDSTAIVALAREEQKGLACFTFAPSDEADGFESDLPYARLAAKRLGVELHIAEAKPELSEEIDFMLYHLDEPQADFAPLQVYLIAALARMLGVKVLLSGAGGDDLFGGYRRHVAISLEKYWRWMPSKSRSLLTRSSGQLPQGQAWARRAQKAFANAGEDRESRLIGYMHWMRNSTALDLLSPRFRAHLDERLLDAEILETTDRLASTTTDLGRLLEIDERYFLVDHNFNYTDKMSMAAGVEVRVPFMDKGVVNLAHQLRTDQLVKGGTSKVALRDAFRGLIPDEVLNRPKVGFGVPLRSWMAGPLRPWINEQLAPEVIRRRGIFNDVAISTLLTESQTGNVDASYPLLAIALIERWMQLFIDQVPGSVGPPSQPTAAWR